ncbi:MAG: amidohydrolase family protein [Planctomycetes bacterium]|nr:amidohydrolase family protein [Planctomycetota bacterium]
MQRSSFAFVKLRSAATLLALLALAAVCPAQSPDEEERFVVIKARKIIPVSGKEVEDGMIVLVNGKVRSIGKGLEFPRNAKVIDASGWVVMPGLINPHTRYGLPRYGRMGVQGQLSVADELVLQPDDFDGLVRAGFTTVGLIPTGAGVPGRATVAHTGGDVKARILAEKSYLNVLSDKATLRGAFERAKAEIDKVDKAKKDFDEKQKQDAAQKAASAPASAPASQPASQPASAPASAPASQPAFQPPPIDPAVQPLVDLIQKKDGIFAMVELSGASDVLHINQVLDKYESARAYVLRNPLQTNLYQVAETLGEKKARVCVWPMLNRLPNSAERLPLVRDLCKAGCEVTLVPLNDSAPEHARVLQRAADLVRDGWDREEALKSVTLHPARLLGLDKRLGTIEKDKDADFIMLDADPLDPRARVRAVMIAGELVYRDEEAE